MIDNAIHHKKLDWNAQVFCDRCYRDITDKSFVDIYLNYYNETDRLRGTSEFPFVQSKHTRLQLCSDCFKKLHL